MKISANNIVVALAAFCVYDYFTRSDNDDYTQGALVDLTQNVNGLFGATNLKTSQAGLNAIATREGNKNTVYADTQGNLTGGIGHLLTAADRLTYSLGSTIPANTISAWFYSDIAHAENLVNYYVTVALTQNQFDALVSMAFNLGGRLFKNSNGSQTQILTDLLAGEYDAASDDILMWDIPSTIISRRETEQTQFNS